MEQMKMSFIRYVVQLGTYVKLTLIMKLIKKIIKTFVRDKLGFEVVRYSPNSSDIAQLVYALNTFDIDLVIDVGANTGQFACEIRNNNYLKKIISFEPLSIAHKELLVANINDKMWEVYERCALGAKIGSVEINISRNLATSSILSIMQSHVHAAPESAYVGTETVPLLTLDSLLTTFDKYKNLFLKIDAQGYEWEILNGAVKILPKLRGLIIEMSLIPLYEGQYLWEDVLDRLQNYGFTLWALQPEFIDPLNGRLLQMNGLFFRNY
jgi:FkbM family methyltransferase